MSGATKRLKFLRGAVISNTVTARAGDVLDVPEILALDLIWTNKAVEVGEAPAPADVQHADPIVQHRDPAPPKRRGRA